MAKISTNKKTVAAKKAAPKKSVAKAEKKVAATKKVVPKSAPAPEKTAKVKAEAEAPTPQQEVGGAESRPESVGEKKVEAKKPSPKSIVKSELVKKYRASAKDTGSVSVQVALLTDRIVALSKHLAKHIHDADSKRGLLIAVGKRRRLLNYVRGNDPKVYAKLIKDLKLKK